MTNNGLELIYRVSEAAVNIPLLKGGRFLFYFLFFFYLSLLLVISRAIDFAR